MQCAGSMWSLARCRGTGGRVKKKGSGPWPWQFGFLDGGAGQMGDWGCGRAGKEVVWCP
jgi:hypothetical protein